MVILKPKNLREMNRQLRALPAEKRKVIVLVGRHPNEGTTNIAVRHHEEWEKHGAVVVRIPGKWTPQYIWHHAGRSKLSLDEAARLQGKASTDWKVMKFLRERQFDVPFVNFHATPLNIELHKIGKIEYFVHPFASRIYEHQNFMPAYSLPVDQNEVVVEFYFNGKSPSHRALSIWEQIQSLPLGSLRKPFHPSLGFTSKTLGLNSGYLNKKAITNADLAVFSEHGAVEFNDVLKHLAKTGLKKRAVKPDLARFVGGLEIP